MQTEWIIISEYCRKSRLDPSFLLMLEEGGLIEIQIEAGERYLPLAQLRRIEEYTRMYYDLSINIEGIDAIRHLLDRMEEMQQEMNRLRSRLSLYE